MGNHLTSSGGDGEKSSKRKQADIEKCLNWAKKFGNLDLSNAQLQSLPHPIEDYLNNLFDNQQEQQRPLSEICLFGNKFKAIPKCLKSEKLMSQYFPKHLQVLNLSYNQLTALGPGFLGSLTNLEKLIISGNQIKKIPKEEISKLLNLQLLDVRGNIGMEMPFVYSCVSLKRLILRNMNLRTIVMPDSENDSPVHSATTSFLPASVTSIFGSSPSKHPMSAPTVIHQLKAQNGEQDRSSFELDQNPFPSMYQVLFNLEQLLLQENEITSIPSRFFLKVPKMKECLIYSNRIHSLDHTGLGCLTQLTTLDLSDNLLTSIPRELRHLVCLQKLHLTKNKIKQLPADCFAHLTALEIIELAQNELTELPHDMSKLSKLVLLDVSCNYIKNIPDATIEGMPILQELYLSGNHLNQLPITLNCSNRITRLRAAYNRISKLTAEQCRALANIGELVLSGNPDLTEIPNELFEYCPNLIRLYLSDCSITNFNAAALSKLPRLEHFSIWGNKLKDDGLLDVAEKQYWFGAEQETQTTAVSASPSTTTISPNGTKTTVTAPAPLLFKIKKPLMTYDIAFNELPLASVTETKLADLLRCIHSEPERALDVQIHCNKREDITTAHMKEHNNTESSCLQFGFGEMKGPIRNSMEDAICVRGNILTIKAPGASTSPNSSNPSITISSPSGDKPAPPSAFEFSFFGIFDGHSGSKASLYSAQRLPELLTKNLQSSSQSLSQTLAGPNVEDQKNLLYKILKNTLKQVNQEMNQQKYKDGCTVVVGLFVNNTIAVFANIGDARAVLCKGNKEKKVYHAQRLTVDHKPRSPDETKRIQDMGGIVIDNRVNGLGVSRAFGDFDNPYVSDEPYMSFVELQKSTMDTTSSSSTSTSSSSSGGSLSSSPSTTKRRSGSVGKRRSHEQPQQHKHEPDVPLKPLFVVFGCDGVWDVVSDERAVHLVADSIFTASSGEVTPPPATGSARKRELMLACNRLREFSFAIGSTDNISTLIVEF